MSTIEQANALIAEHGWVRSTEPLTTLSPAPCPLDEVGLALEKAAERLEKYGWWNAKTTPVSRMGFTECAGHAIHRAAEDASLMDKAYDRFRRHLGLLTIDQIPVWNDSQTDARIVVRALREAAASA